MSFFLLIILLSCTDTFSRLHFFFYSEITLHDNCMSNECSKACTFVIISNSHICTHLVEEKKISIKTLFIWKYFFSFSMHLLFFLYYIHMRLNEVSNIHIYKINGNKILKIWDLKLICKTSVHLHLFQVTVVPWKLKYVVTLRKKMCFESYW